ncbi:MAG: class I SAM-dependent methyltransferase [Acidimicrobiales bacterium]
MTESERAAVGIEGFADGTRYQTARPGYPVAAVSHLVQHLRIESTTRVVDVAAGTGLFTRELLPFTSHVIAVEPGPGMRDEFAVQLPAVEVFDGAAENLPLANASADVITVAQAFHWFDADAALEEFARVLVPGGGLGLLWNERDESVEWVDALSHAILWHLKKPYDMATDFKAILERGGFVNVEKRAFENSQLVDRFALHQRVLSTSYIAVLDAPEQRKILDDVDSVVASFDETFDLPYVTTTYCARAAR